MTRPTTPSQQRNLDRARTQHVRTRRTDSPVTFTTRSKTNPAVHYTLRIEGGDETCTCAGFAYRRSCKHVEQFRARRIREGVKPNVCT